jgi:hypothetical protein
MTASPNGIPPAQLLTGPVVQLSGPALFELNALVSWGLRLVRERDGIAPSAGLLAVAGLIRRAAAMERAMSASGPEPSSLSPNVALSTPTEEEPQTVTAQEAADLTDVTPRHIRRIAHQQPELIGVVRKNPLLLDRNVVLAYAASRPGRRAA